MTARSKPILFNSEMIDRPSPEKDPKTGRFLAGNSGNGGRRKGARSRLSEAFIADLYADWEAHGPDVVKKVREEDPVAYLKVVAAILPKNVNVTSDPLAEMSDEELEENLNMLHQLCGKLLT